MTAYFTCGGTVLRFKLKYQLKKTNSLQYKFLMQDNLTLYFVSLEIRIWTVNQ